MRGSISWLGSAQITAHASDDIVTAYTVRFSMTYRWLKPSSGEILANYKLGGSLAVDPSTVLIQPLPIEAPTNSVFYAWAPSPFRSNEWIVGAESRNPTDQVRTVRIDTHPTREAPDLVANLARILYLPQNHATLARLTQAERYYLALDSGQYRPEEIEMRVSNRGSGAGNTISLIAAYTPDYYRKHVSATESKTYRFKGPPHNRKLWELSISDYTNWHAISLPWHFTFSRYSDASSRAEAESESPVVLCEGELTSIEAGANTSIQSRFSPVLNVEDWRFKDALGFPVRYTSAPAAWPLPGSPEFQRMIATNRAQLGELAPRPLSRKPIVAFWVLFGVSLGFPVFLLMRRCWPAGRRKS